MWLRKKTKINRPEQANCCALMEWCAVMLATLPDLRWLYHVPNGGKRGPIEAKIMKGMGVKPGVLDYHLPVPRKGCCGLWIEMKSDTGRLTAEQQVWREGLTELGHRVIVARHWQEAAEALEAYLGR